MRKLDECLGFLVSENRFTVNLKKQFNSNFSKQQSEKSQQHLRKPLKSSTTNEKDTEIS